MPMCENYTYSNFRILERIKHTVMYICTERYFYKEFRKLGIVSRILKSVVLNE